MVSYMKCEKGQVQKRAVSMTQHLDHISQDPVLLEDPARYRQAEKGHHCSCTTEVNSEKKEELFKVAENFGTVSIKKIQNRN